ncbi:MAG: TNF receptor-associated factor 2 [Edafosvirus sp.]|uniref:TNF receptor-associated factor 2 n=1 Tax=Edafosvirus sp. TaxID=2487765 RepID=A0A3G4ZZE1_9VIRU|nr:MAG: TNF receptor-associated factor 2 [Edafosvirus sp.]
MNDDVLKIGEMEQDALFANKKDKDDCIEISEKNKLDFDLDNFFEYDKVVVPKKNNENEMVGLIAALDDRPPVVGYNYVPRYFNYNVLPEYNFRRPEPHRLGIGKRMRIVPFDKIDNVDYVDYKELEEKKRIEQELCGFEKDDIENFDNSIIDCICGICTGVYRDPIILSCGHIFCRSCLNKHFNSNKDNYNTNRECTYCKKQSTGELIPVICLKNYIDRFIIHCSTLKCCWSGKIEEYVKHEIECEGKVHYCICGEKIEGNKIKDHNTNECLFRKIQCKCCKQLVYFLDMEDHDKSLCNGMISCQCGAKIRKREMEMHIEYSCQCKIIVCPKCADHVMLKNYNNHCNEKCPLRQVFCTTCCDYMTEVEYKMTKHMKDCEMKKLLTFYGKSNKNTDKSIKLTSDLMSKLCPNYKLIGKEIRHNKRK